MKMAHNVSIPELTEAISARLVAQWEVWVKRNGQWLIRGSSGTLMK